MNRRAFRYCTQLVLISLLVVSVLGGNAQGQTLVSKSGKKWSAKLGTFFAYDDNVINQPNLPSARPANLPTNPEDGFFTWNGQAQFKHAFNNKFSIRASYDIDMTVHFELSQYDLTSQIFGFTPTYKISPTMNIMLDYNFIYNIVDGSNFSGVNYIGPSFNHIHPKFGLTRLYYTFKSTNNWQNDLRDNQHNSYGVAHYFFFSNYTRRISVDYQYSQEDTTGNAFDRDNHRIKVKGNTPLVWGWEGEVDVSYTFRDYDTRLGNSGTLRDDTLQRYQVGFSKVLMENWKCLDNVTLILKYRRLENNTNLLARDFDSNRGDIGIKARF